MPNLVSKQSGKSRVQRTHWQFGEPAALIERSIPRQIAKGCERQPFQTSRLRLLAELQQQAPSNSAPLLIGFHGQLPDVQICAKPLGCDEATRIAGLQPSHQTDAQRDQFGMAIDRDRFLRCEPCELRIGFEGQCG